MHQITNVKEEISSKGFAVINNVFTSEEINSIILEISRVDSSLPSVRKTNDLFAIRRFFKVVPSSRKLIFNNRLSSLLSPIFGDDYFLVKAIYFDKPVHSNWFVAYHQDLTISVDKRLEMEGYGPWTLKQDQFAVQPPLDILENNFTIRIHLDDTNENNGALKVIPGSHRKGIYRPEMIDWTKETESIVNVERGGIMIMKPLLLHASNRNSNHLKRRVIHMEFSNRSLVENLNWSEKESFPAIFI
jgi:ectoine hydroxylase-related dioxygenase (phytanoyl-CoA dioxygenase family)